MKHCELCGLDYQCCYHNKTDFNTLILKISQNCPARNNLKSACHCVQQKTEVQRQRYQEVLQGLPPEVKIQMPRLSFLADLYRSFTLTHP